MNGNTGMLKPTPLKIGVGLGNPRIPETLYYRWVTSNHRGTEWN